MVRRNKLDKGEFNRPEPEQPKESLLDKVIYRKEGSAPPLPVMEPMWVRMTVAAQRGDLESASEYQHQMLKVWANAAPADKIEAALRPGFTMLDFHEALMAEDWNWIGEMMEWDDEAWTWYHF